MSTKPNRIVTVVAGSHAPVCGECGQLDRSQTAMAVARDILRAHADAEHMGMGDIIHDNRVPDDTGELDRCQMPIDMCPHLVNDPPALGESTQQKKETAPPSHMSTDSKFKRIVVYVPIEVAISSELVDEEDHEATVSDLLRQVVGDTLLEPESVADHDPFAIVGVSEQTYYEPNATVWTRILPDEDAGIKGTVDNEHTFRLADVEDRQTMSAMGRAFEQTLTTLRTLLKSGALDPMCKVRLVLELQVPEREPASV